MRKFCCSFLSVLCLFFLSGCSSSTPPPAETELVKIFTGHKAAIESLLTTPDNQARRDGLGIKGIYVVSSEPQIVHFTFWARDYFGPGGESKGLAYLETEPRNLVRNIDDNPDMGPPTQGTYYRHISDRWYVFYQSND